MSFFVQANSAIARFSCLGDACPETCCQRWTMQVDDRIHSLWQEKKPELLDAVTLDITGVRTMRVENEICVKLQGGLCSVHRDDGADMLGDACYLYPRSLRRLGEEVVMSAALSCPEYARLALEGITPSTGEAGRLPQSLQDYLPEGLGTGDALVVHRAFVQHVQDEGKPAEQSAMEALLAAQSVALLPPAQWAAAAPFYLKSAQNRLPAPEFSAQDAPNLLHALCGLLATTRKAPSPRLLEAVSFAEQALGVTLHWPQAAISFEEDAHEQGAWNAEAIQPVLRAYMAAQFSLAMFPFAGPGINMQERITVLGVRFATVRLLLLCEPEPDAVRTVQSVSRVLDHLATQDYAMQVYEEAGWTRAARLYGVMGL